MITIENNQNPQSIFSVIRRIHDEYLDSHFAFDPVALSGKLATHSRSMERIRLEVSKANVHALEFYHRLGYMQVEDRGVKLLLELPIGL